MKREIINFVAEWFGKLSKEKKREKINEKEKKDSWKKKKKKN